MNTGGGGPRRPRLSEREEQIVLIAQLEGAIAANRAHARALLDAAREMQHSVDELERALPACVSHSAPPGAFQE